LFQWIDSYNLIAIKIILNNKKMKNTILIFALATGLVACGGNNSNSSSNDSSSNNACLGTGDESFIRSKMEQMDRDVLELNKIGERKYYVRYISWSSGSAVDGDQILDYSNSPCND
jgi:hypothetical protein